MAYPLITEKQTFWADADTLASGYKLFVYLAGTTTKVTTHKETDESSQNTNPIVLNSRGEVPNGLYVAGGSQYKLVLAPSTDTDPPSAAVWTRDELTPYNDTTVTVSEWQDPGFTPTYVSTTSFTVTGDRTSTYTPGLRVKTTNTGGTIYGTILTSAYTSLTTVTIVADSGSLDAGLSAVEVGIIKSTNSSAPQLLDTIPIRRGSTTPSKALRVELDTNLTAATTRVWTAQDKDLTVAGVLDNHGRCQLQYVGTTSIKLAPYNGNGVMINGLVYNIPSAGVTLANTGLTAATLYYIYVYNNAGTLTLEASTTAHATDTTTGVEIKSGDATRTLVGKVYMDSGTPGTYADSATKRWVISWFSQRPRSGLSAFTADRSTGSSSYTELNTEIRVQFICWPNSSVRIQANGGHEHNGTANVNTSIGIDSTSTAQDSYCTYQPASNGIDGPFSVSVFTEGLSGTAVHYATLLGQVPGGSGTGLWTGGSSGARSTLRVEFNG